MTLRTPKTLILVLCMASEVLAADAPSMPSLEKLLRDPTREQWANLSRFDQTLTRLEFESRLDRVFDPARALRPYLRLGDEAVAVYAAPGRDGEPLAVVHFAQSASTERPSPRDFRSPSEYRSRQPAPRARPLLGLRVAIEPADIGGRWAAMEDRSVDFPGFGRINEGDINLIVGRLLRERLMALGASVFLIRDNNEPMLTIKPEALSALALDVMRNRPWLLPESFQLQTAALAADSPRRLHVAENLLLTKTLETRARVELVRRSFRPDITIVLQHNATPASAEGRLNPINRNTFFVNGAYLASELREPEQRFRLLEKLLENTTPTEADVAGAISRRFKAATGFFPVLSGNSETTRLVFPSNPYVVARNLAFNREHDGPVVVTEPYFMNQAETLTRLLAGDYEGERVVAGRPRVSIYREYADCVVGGLSDAYGK